MDRTRLKLTTATLTAVILIALGALPRIWSQENTNAEVPSPVAASEQTVTNDQTLRSYLQIQEQLHTALLAIETNREQLEATAKQNNDIVATRLKQIEQALTAQGERETKAARSSQKLVLFIAAIFGAVGIGAMVLTSWFQLRTMNRVSELSTGGGGGFFRQLDAPVTTINAAAPPAILEAIQRLEQRLLEYQSARASLPEPRSNGNGSHENGHADNDDRDKLTVLLSKGQTLMRLNRPGEALEVFDEALVLDPENADIYVKKGTALERMKKLDEAVACYDRAIASNASMTLAYLCKGGVFNQMERFSEALECYEQALRSQHKTPAAA